MATTHSADPSDLHVDPVGPFTGFGNFFRKEVTDWWKSTRLIVVFALPMLVMLFIVIFFNDMMKEIERVGRNDNQPGEMKQSLIATIVLLFMFQKPVLMYVIIIIFSTMSLLTTEKYTGTLAWNLTKPLSRTALFTAKWLAAVIAIWVAMCALPITIASLLIMTISGVTPEFAKMAPVVGAAFLWIGFWVLLMLTISLFFQSQAAVGAIGITLWIIPNALGELLKNILGEKKGRWFDDCFAPNCASWWYTIAADKDLMPFGKDAVVPDAWGIAFAVWSVVLIVFSLWFFNRQEIGS